ncbi:MAG: hypothetical protein ACPGU9_08415 [Flavobacteriaceae bacterium]
MKKIIFALIIMLFTQNFYAQAVDAEGDIPLDINLTEVYKDKKKFTGLAFSTKDGNDGIILGRRYKKGYYIEHYDKNLKLLNNYDFEVDKKRGSIDEAFLSDGKLCLLEYVYNKKGKAIEYYVNKSSLNSFSFTRTLLLSVPIKKAGGVKFFSFGNTYDGNTYGSFSMSKNAEYIAFTIELNGEKTEKHNIYVFDNSLNKVYETVFERDIKDRKFQLQNVDVSEEDGTLLLLGKSFTREKKKKKDGGKYQYELYKIKNDQKTKLVFDSKDKYIGSLSTIINNGEVFCVGFYSDKNDYRYKGVAYFDIDKTDMSLTKTVYSPFTEQFIQDKYGKNKDKELRNIDLRSIHISDNNECIVNAEEFYITSHYVSNGQGGGYWRYTYHFRDMISLKLNAEGKLLWARNINKKQAASSYSPYLSFTTSYKNDKVYFFINCSDKIRRIRGDRLQFKGIKAKKSNLYAITLDKDGNYEYKKILDDNDSEVPFMVGRGIINNNGKDIIFTGRRGSKKQALKITIPD